MPEDPGLALIRNSPRLLLLSLAHRLLFVASLRNLRRLGRLTFFVGAGIPRVEAPNVIVYDDLRRFPEHSPAARS